MKSYGDDLPNTNNIINYMKEENESFYKKLALLMDNKTIIGFLAAILILLTVNVVLNIIILSKLIGY